MNADLIIFALSEYGLKETPGVADNPFILQMAKDCGFKDYVADSIAWCSLTMNWVALKCGYERSKSLAARSWLNIGEPVTEPELGDIVVLWRDDPHGAFGHVGLYVNKQEPVIYLLAGNQGDALNITGFNKNRLLGYRRLKKITV